MEVNTREVKTVPRILKVIDFDGEKLHCVFNTGEYRIIDVFKLIKGLELPKDHWASLINDKEELSNFELVEGTLSWPYIQKEIIMSSGEKMMATFDLDPVMLYESSTEDVVRNRKNQIGALLRKARKSVGLTQEELAKRAGTTKHYISRIENNHSDLELKTLKRIVEIGLEKKLAIVDP
ncbi:MAG: helix-turn-helix transcriptional regulator [Bacteroidota bacterium]